jgi:hypothetical protein
MENLDTKHHQNHPRPCPQVQVEGVELVGVAPAVVVVGHLKRHSLQVADTDPRVG